MKDLKKMYDEFNLLYFDNELPKDIFIEWSNRMTKNAGVYTYLHDKTNPRGVKEDRIALSVPYHRKYPEDIVDTLLHEMIHVKLPYENHNQIFKNEIVRLKSVYGLEVSLKSKERASVRYIYTCKKCGSEFKRSKSLDLKIYTCFCKGRLTERRVNE